MTKYEINTKEWQLAIIDMSNSFQSVGCFGMTGIFAELSRIAIQGKEEIVECDLRYIDMLYPYLPDCKKIGIKEYIKEKFDLVEVE